MLNKLFGSDKKENFFLDLTDGKAPSTPSVTVAPIAEPTEPKAAAAPPAVEPPAAPVASAAPQPSAEVPATAPTETATEAPAPKPAREPVLVNFATTYLKPSGSGMPRRRPRSNMSGFMDMVRNMRS